MTVTAIAIGMTVYAVLVFLLVLFMRGRDVRRPGEYDE